MGLYHRYILDFFQNARLYVENMMSWEGPAQGLDNGTEMLAVCSSPNSCLNAM